MDELNGIRLSALNETLKLIRDASTDAKQKKALNERRARILWTGGLRATAYVGGRSFVVDESVDTPQTPSSVEYVLGVLGACVIIGFIYNATRRGIKVNNLEIALEGEIDNILTFMRLSDEGHSGYRRIGLKLYVKADAEKDVLMQIFDETLATSPVGNTLTRNIEINASMNVIE